MHLKGKQLKAFQFPIKSACSHLQKASLFTQWVRPKPSGWLLSHPWFMLPLTQPSWVIILSCPGKGQWLPHLLLPLLPQLQPTLLMATSTALTFLHVHNSLIVQKCKSLKKTYITTCWCLLTALQRLPVSLRSKFKSLYLWPSRPHVTWPSLQLYP